MSYIQVKDKPDLARDPESGAVINRNRDAYAAAVQAAARAKQKDKRISDMESDINILKNDIQIIKGLLEKIANG